MTTPKASFSWKNYFKPTPVNLQYWVESAQALLATIAATQFFAHREDLTIYFLVAAGVLDKLSKLFARAAKDYIEVVSVEMPSAVADQVIVKTETKENANF